jgi:hypothetical protein
MIPVARVLPMWSALSHVSMPRLMTATTHREQDWVAMATYRIRRVHEGLEAPVTCRQN